MKHLQSFSLFEAQFSSLTPDQEAFLNKCTKGTWSVNRQTGLVDVEGDFYCSDKGLESLSGISFGHVSGNFSCGRNQLTTLAGAPQTVGGDFGCSENQLTTLTGAPQTVGGDFECNNNQLTTLAGAPQTVDGYFSCSRNQLTTLSGAPQTVGESFFCYYNQLTTLVGAPQTVDGNFYCYGNQLTTLVGAPQKVSWDFDCNDNRLTTLVGAPQTVDGDFSCDSFELQNGAWNPQGWTKILTTGDSEARSLIVTLPYLDPSYWLELHRSNRRKFNEIWLGYRQDPEVRKIALFQEVEAALSGRALDNLNDLQDLRDFGI
jgi:hypothetical protein